MKKNIHVLIALSIFAAALFTTGCTLFQNAVEQTYNTWYVYKNEINVPVSGNETASSTDAVLQNANVYVKYNKTKGLEVLVCSTQKQTISYLGGAYEVEANITTGGTKTYSTEEFGPVKWAALMSTDNFSPKNPPEITVNLDDIMGGSFNLKRLLVNLLIGQLE